MLIQIKYDSNPSHPAVSHPSSAHPMAGFEQESSNMSLKYGFVTGFVGAMCISSFQRKLYFNSISADLSLPKATDLLPTFSKHDDISVHILYLTEDTTLKNSIIWADSFASRLWHKKYFT